MSDVKKEFVQLLANYGHIGFTFVAAIVIGLGGGIYLDDKVFDGRTAPWFTFIGLAFGMNAHAMGTTVPGIARRQNYTCPQSAISYPRHVHTT